MVAITPPVLAELGEACWLQKFGGKKGVGQTAFLAWSDSKVVAVTNAEGDVRLGIIVAPIDTNDTA